MTYIWTWEGRAATGLMVAALCAPVIGAAEDSLTLADLSRGDKCGCASPPVGNRSSAS